jgi:hypothetical protein
MSVTTDFHLEELGPRAFEQLTVALAAATFGPHLAVYGSGRDGGREATFHGRIVWDADPTSTWDGYTVVQAKQREHTASPADNLLWLRGQIRAELNAWMGPKTKRTPFPNYLLIVSNVRLSAPQGGGVDQIRAYVEQELDRNHAAGKTDTPRRRGLRAVRVWHRDTLNALISGNQSIRAAFPALLTVGDLLDRLSALPGLVEPAALAPVLREYAVSTLRNERWVRFGEAGGLQARQFIDRIVVDLPAFRQGEDDRIRVLQTCLDHGDAVLRRSVWNTGRRHLVITGAAGNGKSTISKYLTQVYRAQFLSEDNVNAPTQSLIADTHASLQQRLGRPAPTSRRWPLNVSLPEMANAMGPSGGPSMLRWLAEQVTTRASIEMTPVTLQKWLQTWPCVVFLDGFDEVTAPSLRQRVLDEVTEFVDLADELDADLLLVLTTRPTGYTAASRRNRPHTADFCARTATTSPSCTNGSVCCCKSKRKVPTTSRPGCPSPRCMSWPAPG